MSKKVSVIIPVYNVEEYLKRCVDSVLNQTYKDIEVILVDDGSPDGSPAICDEYALKDKRIRVIHKINGGLSSARNAGLDGHLTGDLVTFVDSDDWIAPDTYEYCISKMEANNADVIQFGYTTTKEYTLNSSIKEEKIELYKNKDILKYYLLASYQTGSYSVCRCLFPVSAVGDNRFREGKINEDIDFKFKVLSNTKRMVVTNLVKYFYFQHGETISSGGLRKKDFDLYDSAEELYKLAIKENDYEILKLAHYKKARTPFSLLCKIAYFGISDNSLFRKETITKLTKEHRQNLNLLLISPMSFSRKVVASFFAINFGLANLFVKLVKSIKAPI